MILQKLSQKQADSIFQSDARYNIWHGSVRSGKTIGSLFRWCDALDHWTGQGDVVMVGKTERTLERNVIKPLQSILGKDAVDIRKGAGEATILGVTCYLVGANDERAETKVRGATVELAYVDEATLIPESFWKMLTSRMSVSGAKLFATTNPDSPYHWLKTDYINRAGELDLKTFHFKLRDNHTLPEDYISGLEKEYTGLWHKRFIEGLWVMAEGAIWDAFNDSIHVVDATEAPEIMRYFTSTDYGTANPFSMGLFGEGKDDRLWLLDEWRWDSKQKGRQLTDGEYQKETASWLKGKGVTPSVEYVDPSAASYIAELMRHNRPVQDAVNAVDDGLRMVNNAFCNDAIRICRTPGTSTGILPEIPSYSWDPKKQLKGIDEPLKVMDHGCDMLRYGYVSTALKPGVSMLEYMRRQIAEQEARV